MTDVRPYRDRARPRPEPPTERFIDTYELCSILHEHQITALNKNNPAHKSFDPEHPKPVKGRPGSPHRWRYPDVLAYIDVLRARGEERERLSDPAEPGAA